ncbi:hypothetical protein IE53DRAFT_161686 [Violaceomyces palustris]|uniref:Uncharacterized protein n=1 Tax=Violaceomyces palustris TaxID=1673888 RepID=A0ACD0NTG4_9BASI|nr:hypothetical protein IE53DRAFT_161686 [Violaceomyces palustris]
MGMSGTRKLDDFTRSVRGTVTTSQFRVPGVGLRSHRPTKPPSLFFIHLTVSIGSGRGTLPSSIVIKWNGPRVTCLSPPPGPRTEGGRRKACERAQKSRGDGGRGKEVAPLGTTVICVCVQFVVGRRCRRNFLAKSLLPPAAAPVFRAHQGMQEKGRVSVRGMRRTRVQGDH